MSYPYYYGKYQISRSLIGADIFYIARNNVGNVIFRERSEEKLKKAISSAEELRKREEEEREKLQAQKEKAKEERKARKLFANKLQEEVQERKEEAEIEPVNETRTAGEPINEQPVHSATDASSKTKASFWDKLK